MTVPECKKFLVEFKNKERSQDGSITGRVDQVIAIDHRDAELLAAEKCEAGEEVTRIDVNGRAHENYYGNVQCPRCFKGYSIEDVFRINAQQVGILVRHLSPKTSE